MRNRGFSQIVEQGEDGELFFGTTVWISSFPELCRAAADGLSKGAGKMITVAKPSLLRYLVNGSVAVMEHDAGLVDSD